MVPGMAGVTLMVGVRVPVALLMAVRVLGRVLVRVVVRWVFAHLESFRAAALPIGERAARLRIIAGPSSAGAIPHY